MDRKTHYFIALPIEKQVKESIFNWLKEENLPFKRFVHKEDYHITLAFLGDVDPILLKELQEALVAIAKKHQPFMLNVDQLGFFGQKFTPRVFWTSVKREEKLFELQKSVQALCEELGLELDKRTYNPHITIARQYIGGYPFADEELNQSFQSYLKSKSWQVSSFVIYQTHLDQTPKYEEIASFPL